MSPSDMQLQKLSVILLAPSQLSAGVVFPVVFCSLHVHQFLHTILFCSLRIAHHTVYNDLIVLPK